MVKQAMIKGQCQVSFIKPTPFTILQIFNDPIHGHIELHPLLVKIIDTPQFQRLRHIKQLGTKNLVYPGATHTRFEHSIGVAYLAGCLLKTLHENQPELNITKHDFLCVQIAALCHDMGHGPFSHLFDGMFIPEVQPDGKWKHEQASVDMFHCMRKKNGLDKEMDRFRLNLDEDIKFIEELILKGQKDGKFKIFSILQWSMKGRTEDKSFLYEIVANKVNGVDVDKWDYLVRDCYYLGIPCGFDSQRLLKSARVCNVNGRKHICFRDKVADNIYGMFHTRYTLHREALQHKIGYIIDVKIKDAFVLANNQLKISEKKDDMLKYTELTDHIFDQILHPSDSHRDLTAAQCILEDIVERKLPKFVGEARLKEDGLREELKARLEEQPDKASRIKVYQEELKNKWEKARIDSPLTVGDFEIHVLEMGFGEVGNEPIDNVHFYSKNDLKTAFKMEKYQVSSLKPKRFHEYLMRVYYKKTDGSYRDVQQKAEKSFHEFCKNNELIDLVVDLN
ncbi:deoxynucleoside triphosphate triphosphohydrolase SAMHD1-like [Carassius carassius]|uniref:deoxynucleoside triphosphate triphosphohydrolase SAMHD1-like n=1 Tax=Carassius carassius TaxID=217509 RepID=UPI002868FDE6|nr:deoxynucleoside triphosphate triphosphohydrolase SAMHD1-like [Carassius carassius]